MFRDCPPFGWRGAISEVAASGRERQEAYNAAHGITPTGIRKAIRDIAERVRAVAETRAEYAAATEAAELPRDEIHRLIRDLEGQMKEAARQLEFEKAALLRDQIVELRRTLAAEEGENSIVPRELAHAARPKRV